MPAFRPILERFADKLALDPETGCWNWTAYTTKKGYGRLQIGAGKNSEAHRVSYELFNGDIPKHLEIDHICRNRRCVNPNHLRLLTHRENTDFDRRKTHCEKGHEYTPGSYYSYKTKTGMGRWCKECFRVRQAKKLGVPVETLGTREHPKARTKCRNGHVFAEVGYYDKTQGGKTKRVCRACMDAWNKKWNHIRRAARAAGCSPSMTITP